MVPRTAFPLLSDNSLRGICSNLPLSQLFHDIPHVHPRWDLASACSLTTKRRLVLYLGDQVDHLFAKETYHYPFPYASELVTRNGLGLLFPSLRDTSPLDALSLASLEPFIATRLISRMPSISNLSIAMRAIPLSSLKQVIHLLESWTDNLASFSLFYHPTDENSSEETLHHLVSLLNYAPHLKSLTLHLGHNKSFKVLPELSILGRLKRFTLHLRQGDNCQQKVNSEQFFEQLHQHLASNTSLTSLRLHIDCLRISTLYRALSGSPALTRSSLTLRGSLNSGQRSLAFPRVTEEPGWNGFTRLQALELRLLYFYQNLAWCSTTCSPFCNVQYLSLLYASKVFLTCSPEAELPLPLPSVKVLRISFQPADHHALEWNHWSTLFPSLQVLHLSVESGKCACFQLPVQPQMPTPSGTRRRRRLNDGEKAELLNGCITQLFAPISRLCRATLRKAVVEGSFDAGLGNGDLYYSTILTLNTN